MKRIIALLLIINCQLSIVNCLAQTLYICKDGDYTTHTLAEGLAIDLTDRPDSITFSEPAIPWTVNIVYNGNTATVSMPTFMASKVTCTSGNSPRVCIQNTDTSHEVFYNVSGSSSNGSLTITADYKMTVKLNGVSLTSSLGEAMRFKCGKRTALVLAKGTTNTFADTDDGGLTASPTDEHKACIYTKGHIEISGAGTLNVTGNYNHAIATKEYIKVKKSVTAINILGAKGDAIHAGEYFQQNGGIITIDENTLADGIQVEYKTDEEGAIVKDEENTGAVTLSGGTLHISTSATQDIKCIKADGDVTIDGSTLQLNATARGSRGIQTDGSVTIAESEGLTTTLTFFARGGKCTLEEDEDDPHKCMGINASKHITITGGTIDITASGPSANGLKADGNLLVSGGSLTIAATATSTNGMKIGGDVTFTGGTTTVTSTGTKSKGIVYSGTKTITPPATVQASFNYKQ